MISRVSFYNSAQSVKLVFFAWSFMLSLLLSCKNEHVPKVIAELPVLSTPHVVTGSLGVFSVQVAGAVTNEGTSTVQAWGVCYSTNPTPTINDNFIVSGNGLGNFTITISNLIPGKKYYIRTYATNAKGTSYSQEINFTTLAARSINIAKPIIKNIQFIDARIEVTFQSVGSYGPFTYIGICLDTFPNPALDKNNVSTYKFANSEVGSFNVNASTVNAQLMKPNHTYYVRAVAIDSYAPNPHVVYSEQVNFTTNNIPANALAPTVSTTEVSLNGFDVTHGMGDSAIAQFELTGLISNDGNLPITEKGFLLHLGTSTPDFTNSNDIDRVFMVPLAGNSMDVNNPFSHYINITSNVHAFHICAYAKNAVGIGYGPVVSKTALVPWDWEY